MEEYIVQALRKLILNSTISTLKMVTHAHVLYSTQEFDTHSQGSSQKFIFKQVGGFGSKHICGFLTTSKGFCLGKRGAPPSLARSLLRLIGTAPERLMNAQSCWTKYVVSFPAFSTKEMGLALLARNLGLADSALPGIWSQSDCSYLLITW